MATVIQRRTKPLPELSARDISFDAASVGTRQPGQLDQIKEMIPGESAAIYVGGLGVIPQDQPVAVIVWALIGLIITLIVKSQQTDPRTGAQVSIQKLEWNQVIVSAAAFVVWVYALGGGPFEALGLYVPWVATLLVLGYTYAMPQVLGVVDRVLK